MKKYKISIITVTYNAEKTIEQTIASVINQTYDNLEYIIIDGKSSDNTVNIAGKYSNKIYKIISEPDSGIYDAMNKGVSIATGDYIEFIGSDDMLYSPTTIQSVVAQLDDSVDIISGKELFVDEQTCHQHVCSNEHAKNQQLFSGENVPHGALFVKKRLLVKYPFDTSYRILADHKFFLQCYFDESVNIKYINDIILYFSLNGTSGTLIKQCKLEKEKIYKELNLPFTCYSPHGLKKILKKFFMWLGIFNKIKSVENYVQKKYIWEKHHCNNKICRWCGRYEK